MYTTVCKIIVRFDVQTYRTYHIVVLYVSHQSHQPDLLLCSCITLCGKCMYGNQLTEVAHDRHVGLGNFDVCWLKHENKTFRSLLATSHCEAGGMHESTFNGAYSGLHLRIELLIEYSACNRGVYGDGETSCLLGARHQFVSQ